MRAAFFDLDLTLLDVNSASLWIKRELALGHISKRFAWKGAWWVGLYQLGVARMEDVLERALSTVAGEEEEPIRARTEAFYDEMVRHRFRRGAADVLAAHRRDGDLLVLLTSSSPYMSQRAMDQLSLDGFLCTHFEVEGGRFTGRPAGPLCYGPGKLTHAKRFAEVQGIDLSASSFYTDSYSDLAMLEAVGRPVCVHPDPRLRRAARRRGWEIADWGDALPSTSEGA